jgi:glycosyltransferase involved in cell wall biosynthesis
MKRDDPRLHVAVLDEELPFPLTSGKRIRTFQLLSRLAKQHRITYLCHQSVESSEQATAEAKLREAGITPLVVHRQVPRKAGLSFYARLAANLLSPLPYSVTSHQSDALGKAIRVLDQRDPPDLWHCEWTPYAQALRHARLTAPWTVMAHNVETLIWQRYAEAERNPAKRWYIRGQQRKFERFERWAYSSCDRPLAVSADDARLMRERLGATDPAVVDNGVDVDFFQPSSRALRDPKRLLFLGSLDWRPNLDGVNLLLDEIFPKALRAMPDATLAVVGRKPPQWLRQRIASFRQVELHADVPDTRPFLASAGMLVVPLRIGGGSRLKILEALATDLPVVSTSVGAEGLELTPGRHLTIADSADRFAMAIGDVSQRHSASLDQAREGGAWVRERYNWSRLAEKLEEVWLQTVQTPAKRKSNAAVPSS